MRLRLCISPCRQPNLQLPAHMGALAGRLRGNRLGKVLPSFIWKGGGGAKKEEECGGSPRVIFPTRPWEISEIWGQGCFLTRALNTHPSSFRLPHSYGSVLSASRDERFDGAAVKVSICTSYKGKLQSFVFVCVFPPFSLQREQKNPQKTNKPRWAVQATIYRHQPSAPCKIWMSQITMIPTLTCSSDILRMANVFSLFPRSVLVCLQARLPRLAVFYFALCCLFTVHDLFSAHQQVRWHWN